MPLLSRIQTILTIRWPRLKESVTQRSGVRPSVRSVYSPWLTRGSKRRGQRTFRPDNTNDRHTCLRHIRSLWVSPCRTWTWVGVGSIHGLGWVWFSCAKNWRKKQGSASVIVSQQPTATYDNVTYFLCSILAEYNYNSGAVQFSVSYIASLQHTCIIDTAVGWWFSWVGSHIGQNGLWKLKRWPKSICGPSVMPTPAPLCLRIPRRYTSDNTTMVIIIRAVTQLRIAENIYTVSKKNPIF